ncbi:hypothetical protein [Oceanimonas sp. CAM02]|uniref:hypothetical protein n=1 Tax=Oceanimonas sp. CAM02 TaxID=3080336 RepID=UPI0029358E3C|nr:hypothetical protein [Oceanimonas sp. CAM02]MDV2857233.1 hypothetical protein [Oceanimonas sp. CAM02]
MNIVVIGASNSAMHSNYVDALKLRHKVNNLSSGRNPIHYYIKTLIENHNLLKACDLIIIDHVVNDINFYLNKTKDLGVEYKTHIENFYSLITHLNKPTINILFPILSIKNEDYSNRYRYFSELSESLGITYLDLSRVKFNENDFIDKYHIKRERSFTLGLYLLNTINIFLEYQKSDNHDHHDYFASNFYNLVTAKDICSEKVNEFKNSLLKLKYINGEYFNLIDTEINTITKTDSENSIISFGYFNEKDQLNCFEIKTKRNDNLIYTVNGKGYYHEMLDRYIPVENLSGIHPLSKKKSEQLLMGRYVGEDFQWSNKTYHPLNLVEILTYKNKKVPIKQKIKNKFHFNYDEIKELYEKTTSSETAALTMDEKKIIKKAYIKINEIEPRLSRKLRKIYNKN